MSRKLKQVISCQSFSPISDVRDGIIVTKDGKFVKLMEFSPINYGLRSNEDKNMITAQYAAAIRSFPSVVQIKVLSNRANVEHYISGMVESVRHEKNEGTRELMREQIDMMSEFGTSRKAYPVASFSHSSTRKKRDSHIVHHHGMKSEAPLRDRRTPSEATFGPAATL